MVAITYWAFGHIGAGRRNLYNYYRWLGDETATFMAADELIFNPALADLDQVARVAGIVL